MKVKKSDLRRLELHGGVETWVPLEPSKPRVLCLYVSLPEEITDVTLSSIHSQSLPVEKLVLVSERSCKPSLGERVSEVVNNALAKEDLSRFDYILMVHSDNVLSCDFLERNLVVEPDVMGFGSPMIIKVQTFLEVMGGRFHPLQDDVYLRHRFAVAGFPASAPVVKAGLKRVTGTTHEVIGYNMMRGELKYRFGFEPVHVFFNNFKPSPRNFWCLVGYFKALLSRKPLFDTAVFMRRTHFQTLRNPSKLLSRVQRRIKFGYGPSWVYGPQVLQLDTHNFCNEACGYCNVEFLCAGKHGRMSLGVAERALREVGSYVKHVKLFLNGDPLLENRMPELASLARRYSRGSIIIFSNGAANANKYLLRDRNLDEVHFTFSANTPETYLKVHGKPYFYKALATIEWFARSKFPSQKIVVRYVTVPENVGEITGWKHRFRGLDTIVTPLHCGFEQKASDKLLEGGGKVHKLPLWIGKLADDQPCGCWGNMAVSWDGRILQCCDSPYSVNYGRVGEVSLLTAWRRRLENKMNNPACKACNLKHPRWKQILDKYVEVSYYTELIGK